jgi:plastocyanin
MKLLANHRNLAFLVVLTIASILLLAILAINFRTESANQLPPRIDCPNLCEITITSQGFTQAAVVVARGTSIVWKNTDSITHSISETGANWSFSTGIIEPAQTSKPIVFSSEGTFYYYCELTMMHGEITVVG